MAEKSLTEINREVRLLYQKGNEALLRENYDYAIDLFNQVLAREPGLFDARKLLRSAQLKKTGGGGGSNFFKKAWSSASSSPLVAKAQIALRKDPAEALQVAEQILNSDPTNAAAHRVIVEGAEAMQLPRTALMSLDVLVKSSSKDKSLAIQYANTLAEIGESAKAERFLAEFMKGFQYDNELSQALKNLSARKTLGEKGYKSIATGQGSYRDILRDEKEAVELEQEKRVQKTEDLVERLISEKEARLKTEPGNLKVLRDLAEMYTQKKQFDRALNYYSQIKSTEAGGSDPTLDRAIAETKVRRFEHEIAQLDPAAPDTAEKAAALNAEKLNFQIEECQKRVEKFPTDLAIRFEMGALYFQGGKIGEAIKEFQKSQGNPHKKIASMNYLAQCFAARKMYDLAARTLQNAIKEKIVFDDEKKELIYNLGTVLESMANAATESETKTRLLNEAIEQFKLIYEVDADYKDVGPKMDAFYASQ